MVFILLKTRVYRIAFQNVLLDVGFTFVHKKMVKFLLIFYLYLEYGVAVPKVAVAIQKAVKTAVYNMADVTLDDVNIHVVGIVTEKAAKPDLKDLFNEDFLND